ncbi:MAG TPA: helix-hairpin-helix domain-containing protein, partial [Anaerolineaceae bacterium]|nr:helix-hairpin-helix domain-containing protein [Anaerolineaceae bacterium]
NLSQAPVEINRADRPQLLRVPGIGPRSVEKLLAARRLGQLRSLEALRSLGVNARRAAPFILLDGHKPPLQLPLF